MGNRSILDAATILRASASAAISATTSEAALITDLFSLTHPLHLSVDNPDFDCRVVIHEIVVTGSPTSVTWTIEVGADSSMSGAKEVGRVIWNGTSKKAEIPLSTYAIRQAFANPGAIRVSCAIAGGASPTVDYAAFITKND